MKLHELHLVHQDYYQKTSPLKAKAAIETNSGLKVEIEFTPEMTAKLAQACAEIVASMVRGAGPHLHRENMEDPTLKLASNVVEG